MRIIHRIFPGTIWCLAMVLLLINLTGCSTDPGHIFVSPEGDDDNPGTIQKPFRTIEKAASVTGPGDICYLREGTYSEVLRPVRSGERGNPVTFRSYNGERVVVSSMEPVSGWTFDSAQVYKAQVEADLGQENMVMAGGVLCDLARWPDNTDGNPYTLNSLRNSGGSEREIKKDAFLEYEGGIPDHPWEHGGSLFFFGDAKGSGWLAWRSFIERKDGNRIWFRLPSSWVGSYHAPGDGGEFFLQGIREVLDHPNEWYLDSAGTLYIQLPDGGMPEAGEVLMRTRKLAIDLSGLDHIVIKDLAVFGGSIMVTGGASHNHLSGITSYYGNHTAGIIDGYYTEGRSVFIDGDDNRLERSEVAFGAGSGIFVSGKGNVIENCLIHDFNTLGCYDGPVILRNGERTVLRMNTIYNAGRDGIMLFHKDSEVAYNDVSRTNLIAHDCGPIYTLGGPYNSEIHHNWFHDIGGRGKLYKGTGIYLDNSSVGFSVHHNVVWNTSWSSIHININGKDLEIYNNTFWNGSEVMGWWRPKAGEAFNLKEDAHLTNVRVWNNLSDDDNWDPQAILEGNLTLDHDPFLDSRAGDFRLKEDLGKNVGAYEFGGAEWKAGIDWDPVEGPVGHCNYGILKRE